MTSGTLSSMVAKYLPRFVVGIGIFIVFFAQYSNGLTCITCETVVSDTSTSPAPADGCLDIAQAKDTDKQACTTEKSCALVIVMEKMSENATLISKTVSRSCADPTTGVWFLDTPFTPNTCSNVENGDKVTEFKNKMKDDKAKKLQSFQMAHVCFCDTDSCEKRDAMWTDEKLVEYFKNWVAPPPTTEKITTGDGGGGGGDSTEESEIASKTWKIEAIPKIIVFLIAAVSLVSSLSYLSSSSA